MPKTLFLWATTLSLMSATAFSATPETTTKAPLTERELYSDRMSHTENPYTVDTGKLQIDWDFLQKTENEESTFTSVMPIVIKYGVTSSSELQIEIEPFVKTETRTSDEEEPASAATTEHSGFGDITLRLKRNFWGNDVGHTALSLNPFLKIPTAASGVGNNHFEGGILAPYIIELPYGVDLGTALGFSYMMDHTETFHRPEGKIAISLTKDFSDNFGGVAEIATSQSLEDRPQYVTSFTLGFSYYANEQFQLNIGGEFGLTDDADDLSIVTGGAYRF